VTAYYVPRTASPADWVAFACHAGPSGPLGASRPPLNEGIVEDAAYARRAQQLIARAVDETM
jgi:hypothetical protein